jgi:hypothetical protein
MSNSEKNRTSGHKVNVTVVKKKPSSGLNEPVQHKVNVRVVKKRKRFTRRWKIQLVVVVLILGGIWFVMRTISAPVTGHDVAASDMLQTNIPAKAKPDTSATTINDNQYFQLALPAGYKAQASNQAVPGLSYQKTIIKPGAFGSIIINIAIKPIPGGGLASDSSYNLRVQSPAHYKVSHQTIDGGDVVIFNDAQSAAVVAFWSHGGYLATISLNAGINNPASDDNADIVRALQPILDAWKWR